MHEVIRRHAMAAWEVVRRGAPNPLANRLVADEDVLCYLSADRTRALLDATGYVGDAPQRARQIVAVIRDRIGESRP